MMNHRTLRLTRQLVTTAAAALLFGAVSVVHAEGSENYPNRVVRVVVPYPAGGNTDIITREVMQRVSTKLGQTFVVENKPGGNSVIGTGYVSKANPDGYTLGVVIGAFANNFALYKNLPYSENSFTPVTQMTRTSLVVVSALPGVESIEGLVNAGKNKDKPLTYASSGVASAAHILSERLIRSANIEHIQHIPYKGSAEMVSDLVSGRVGFVFDAISAMGPHIKSNKLKALAVTGGSRSSQIPDVPSMVEAGYPDMVAYAWAGLIAPAGTSKTIVEKLAATVKEVLKDPELTAKLEAISTEPVGSAPSDFSEFVKKETEINGNLLKELGVTLD